MLILKNGHRRSLAAAFVALVALCASVGAAVPANGATGDRAALPAVANPALAGTLDPAERAALGRNGFVVEAPTALRPTPGDDPQHTGGPSHTVYWQFYDLYEQHYQQAVPTFLTGDALLHTWHVIYDQTLIVLERHALAPKLARLSRGLMAATAAQASAARDPRIAAAARANLGYLAVAARLLDPAAPLPAVPAPVRAEVSRELALIAARRGYATSPLRGYPVDYSKFIPRGHYAGDAALSRYAQAMTWCGLLTFHLNGPDGTARTRQALLLVRALTADAALGRLWADVFDPITMWVGPSDDLTARDYAAALARVYPANAPVDAFADDARLARFRALANALPDPRIADGFVPGAAAAAPGKGFRLFGQRFVPDAAIVQALVWDKVGTPARPRLWPSGLDVAAAFGSARASALVSGPSPYNATRYAHYARQLAATRRAALTLPRTLYGGWLDTLRAVWGPVPPAAPAFMKGAAWGDKTLATGLASWAELRHDTILYTKQTGLGGGGPVPPAVPAYVEPAPLVYARLLSLIGALKATLNAEGVRDTLPQPVRPVPAVHAAGVQGRARLPRRAGRRRGVGRAGAARGRARVARPDRLERRPRRRADELRRPEPRDRLLSGQRGGQGPAAGRQAGRRDRRCLHRADERGGVGGSGGRRAAALRRRYHQRAALAGARRRLLLLRVPPAHRQSPHRRRLATTPPPPRPPRMDVRVYSVLTRARASSARPRGGHAAR